MDMDPTTHDMLGNMVDGYYWLWTQLSFEDAVEAFKSLGNEHAAAIAERLAVTPMTSPPS
jgi:hypothetical protein